jgi:hypothetical protein
MKSDNIEANPQYHRLLNVGEIIVIGDEEFNLNDFKWYPIDEECISETNILGVDDAPIRRKV